MCTIHYIRRQPTSEACGGSVPERFELQQGILRVQEKTIAALISCLMQAIYGEWSSNFFDGKNIYNIV